MALTLGEQLKAAREEKGMSREELSLTTHIKEHYLRAMEEDRFQDLPSPVQQKGFLRAYAREVGLNPRVLIHQLTSPNDPARSPAERGEPGSQGGISDQPEPEDEPGPGEETFGRIGDRLSSQRESLGLSREDVENQIHIPTRYLRAIERGYLDQLPSTVQGRGMVKNYAEFLGLDPEPLLLSYADVLQERLQAQRNLEPKTSRSFRLPLWLRRILTGPSLAGILVVLLVGAALIWSGFQVLGRNPGAGDATATIPGVAEVLLPSSTAPPSPTLTRTPAPPPGEGAEPPPQTPSPGVEEQVSPQPTADQGEVQIQLIISQRAFVQVKVDGELEYSGRMGPGTVHLFGGEERVELTTGNAAGVEVIFNQRDLGVLGLYGEVVNRIFTAEGIATATPTVTPTPTVTQTPTQTNTPSPTPLDLGGE